jgi:hypothetical protein
VTVSERIVRLCCRWLPAHLSDWGEAMAREARSIERPVAALSFAMGCVIWAARKAAAEALRQAMAPGAGPIEKETMMTGQYGWRLRDLATVCGAVATGMGLIYLSAAGAPAQLLTMNAAALVAGLVLVLSLLGREPMDRPVVGPVTVAIGVILMLTAALGEEASGARRWASVAQVVLQPSLIGLPLLIVGFARSRDALTATGVVLAVVAMAWQPDRAMAATLVAGIGAVALMTRERLAIGLTGVALIGFAVACLQPDVVPPTPFVDRVYRTALSTGMVAGTAVWLGTAVLLAPAVLGLARDRANRVIYAAFGATWLTVVCAAIAGDYPTPLVGYGGSAIVGYLLATLALTLRERFPAATTAREARPSGGSEADALRASAT